MLSHLISKDNSILREWVVRRKAEYTFVDIVASKGVVAVDFKKASLLRDMTELLTQGFQITELTSQQDSERSDIMATLQKLPGTITKSMKASHVQKEVYSFEHGMPVGDSSTRKRSRMMVDSGVAYGGRRQDVNKELEDDELENLSKTAKVADTSSSDEEELTSKLWNTPASVNSSVRILSNMKLTNRMKKMRRRKAFRKRLAMEQLSRDYEQVTSEVKTLDLKGQDIGVKLIETAVEQVGPSCARAGTSTDQLSSAVDCEEKKDELNNTSSTWDELNLNDPYDSEDERDFEAALEKWNQHQADSDTLSGLGFAIPLPDLNEDKPTTQEEEVNKGLGNAQEVSKDSTQEKKGDNGANSAVDGSEDSTVIDELTADMDDLDLEAEVRDWFEISAEEESRLLDGCPDELPDMSVEELDVALAGILKDMNVRLLRSMNAAL